MYEKYGLEMFKMLDAEFALVIYDGQKGSMIAARDPIGIRPLFYGKDEKGGMMFASEAKNLVGLTKSIEPFPPGHYYADGRFVCYNDIAARRPRSQDDLETTCYKIKEKADSRNRKAARCRRADRLSAVGRTGQLAGLRRVAEAVEKTDTHLCHRHERGRYRSQIRKGSR